jgi:hypothetical protein
MKLIDKKKKDQELKAHFFFKKKRVALRPLCRNPANENTMTAAQADFKICKGPCGLFLALAI